jgi:hypothetical protein
MATSPAASLPSRFIAGTTVAYTCTRAPYTPGDGWTLTLYLAGQSTLSVVATTSGEGYLVTIPAAATATVQVAGCGWSAGGDVITRAAGSFPSDGVLPGYFVTHPDLPPHGYALSLPSATTARINAPASAAGSSVTLPFRFPEGIYTWQERLTKGSEVVTGDQGTLTIAPDIAGAPAGTYQSPEETMLRMVNDIILGRIATDTESYQIADRAKTATRMRDWFEFRSYLERAVAQQRNPGKLGIVRAVFTGASAES